MLSVLLNMGRIWSVSFSDRTMQVIWSRPSGSFIVVEICERVMSVWCDFSILQFNMHEGIARCMFQLYGNYMGLFDSKDLHRNFRGFKCVGFICTLVV